MFVLTGAVVIRLLSVYFSEGYIFQQEHFGIAEPWPEGAEAESYEYILYQTLHGYWFRMMDWAGLRIPDDQMMLVRLIHAAFSMMTVLLGYQLARIAGSEKGSRLAFVLLAFAWLLPLISVRNYAFNLAVPFLVLAVWLGRLSYRQYRRLSGVAGFFGGIAIALYPYASVYWLLFVVLTLILHGRWFRFLLLWLGTAIAMYLAGILLMPGAWNNPAECLSYLVPAYDHWQWALNDRFWAGPLVLVLVLGPPLGFFILAGFFRLRRDTLRIGLPALVCLLASVMMKDQYGLMIVAFPFVVITGSLSWMNQLEKSRWLEKFRPVYYAGLGYFWVFNVMLMFWFSTLSPRKPVLDAMRFAGHQEEITTLVVNQQGLDRPVLFPAYYAGKPLKITYITSNEDIDSVALCLSTAPPDQLPAYVMFYGDENLKQRILDTYEAVPASGFTGIYRPGFTERMLRRWLDTPLSGSVVIYRNDVFYWYQNRKEWN